jgi:hypothetical protein
MRALFDAIGLDRDTFGATPFTRLAELRRLLGAGLLDASFRWRVPSPTPHRTDERSGGGISAGDGFPGVG